MSAIATERESRPGRFRAAGASTPTVLLATTGPQASDAAAVSRLATLLLVTILILVGAVMIWAFVWSFRRSKRRILRPSSPPTTSADVWSMHVLPDESDEGDSPGS